MERTHVCLAQQCGFVRRQVRALSLVLLLSLVPAGPMQGETIKETMNVSTLSQATSSALCSLLKIKGNTQVVDYMTHVMQYSESGWTQYISGTLQSQPFALSYRGFLTGDFGGNIDVVFNGDGQWGSTWLFANGRATWYYDSAANGYLVENFEQLTALDDVGHAWYVGAGSLGVEVDGSWSEGWLHEGSGLTMTSDASASGSTYYVVVTNTTLHVDKQPTPTPPIIIVDPSTTAWDQYLIKPSNSQAVEVIDYTENYTVKLTHEGTRVNPEPSGLLALGSGLAGLGGVFFRRRPPSPRLRRTRRR